MVSKKLEATRKKGRRNRVTIEDQYVGYEPLYEPGQTSPGVKDRDRLWTKGANWYNYHYKAKDYVPYVIDFVEEVCGFTKEEATSLKKLRDWEVSGNLGKVARLHYRGYEYSEEQIERYKE